MQLNNGPEGKKKTAFLETLKISTKKAKVVDKIVKQISSTHLGHFITMFNIHGSVHCSMTQ
jgi:hypothetical protein